MTFWTDMSDNRETVIKVYISPRASRAFTICTAHDALCPPRTTTEERVSSGGIPSPARDAQTTWDTFGYRKSFLNFVYINITPRGQ